eukprot:754086-Hanusia_phi.AAC.11
MQLIESYLFALVCSLFLQVSLQNSFVTKNISQKTACPGAENALFVTLATSQTINPSNQDSNTAINISINIRGIATVSVPGGSIRISDDSKAFSGYAILYSDLLASSSTLTVDNAVDVGIQVGDLVAVGDEIVKVTLIQGTGCAPSFLVQSSCMQDMRVLRAQAGTVASTHRRGTLTYKVVANYIVDGMGYGSVSTTTTNTQGILNVENVSSFVPHFLKSTTIQYALLDHEIVEITAILHTTGYAMKLSEFEIKLSFSSTPTIPINQTVYLFFPNASVYLEIISYQEPGNIAEVTSTKFFDNQPQEFVISVIQVKRGQKATVNAIHNPNTTIFLLHNTWTVFNNQSMFQAGTGQLNLSTISKMDALQVVSFSFPVQNSFIPQEPAFIQIYVAGVSNTNYFIPMDYPPVSYQFPFKMPLLICRAGTWIKDGNRTCLPCEVGKFSQACGGAACTACSASTFTSSPGQTFCSNCVAGFYCPGNSDKLPCPPGLYADSGASACLRCPPGAFCLGASTRQPCAKGTFSNASGVTACQDCPAGRFAPQTGLTACLVCAIGTFSKQPSASVCELCPPGTFGPWTEQTSCKSCASGHYQSNYQSSFCLECPVNSGARIVMGLCYGSCGGSTSVSDCQCHLGYTRFDHFGLDCVPIAFRKAAVGQSSSCKDSLNLIAVTMSVNAEYKSIVQNVEIKAAGENYLPAILRMQSTSGNGFSATALTDARGAINRINISQAGSGFGYGQVPLDIFYSAGCAVDDSGCGAYLQTSSISTIQLSDNGTGCNGTGYTDGIMKISSKQGSGFLASFKTDARGRLMSWSIAQASDRGRGYQSVQRATLYYSVRTSCGPSGPSQMCPQENTITAISVRDGTQGCDTSTMIYASGGGGEGFQASVTQIDANVQLKILNHGINYTSEPIFYSSNPNCICISNSSTNKTVLNGCLQFSRATGAVVLAHPALNGQLVAQTGSRLVMSSDSISKFSRQQQNVSISALPFHTVSSSITETCGILSNSSAICWGQSLNRLLADSVETWTCGYSARYWRFVTLSTRGGGGGPVSMAQIQFFRSGLQLTVIQVTNPGGNNQGNLPSNVLEGNSITYWLDVNKKPLQFDFGQAVIVDRSASTLHAKS